ncbi:MAG: glycerol kinase GlpK [Pseudohongiellaceae bacterium]
MKTHILALDQGTTSSRAIIFDREGRRVGSGQLEYPQHYPHNGWVEHDPEDIWKTSLASARDALEDAGLDASEIACAGISNQRETTLVWDRSTGKPVYNAIVWQDRRTAGYCEALKQRGLEQTIQAKTGLLIDSYFSASKINWIMNQVPGARERADKGELAFGTVDTFLLWRLTGGAHYTDATNASRTLLFNLEEQDWDEELLKIFDVPRSLLPEVLDSAADFGTIQSDLLGATIPIGGVAGDQQAATVGQCCFAQGEAKSTYGTGCFLVMNTGSEILRSRNRLLSTVAYRLDGKVTYGLEGSIFMAGATMQWVRDELHLIDNVADSEALANSVSKDLSVYLVPAFTGLGAPYWDADARGALFGLTRDSGVKEIVTAALMSVCYQTRDLQLAMEADGASLAALRVDGGMAANNFMLQNLADLLSCQIDRPAITETTALGAAWLAGLQCGLFDSLQSISKHWQLDRSFEPARDAQWRVRQYEGWQDAVRRTKSKLSE